MSYQQTILTYLGAAPTVGATVTLFDSTVSFPSGGFHLLEQQWFQYSIRAGDAGATGSGELEFAFSVDKGVTWFPFYGATVAHYDTAAPLDATETVADEVYVGLYKDVRVRYTNVTTAPTVFVVNMALQCQKATSKTSATDLLHEQ